MFDNSLKTEKARARNLIVIRAIRIDNKSNEEAADLADCSLANVNTALAGTNLASIEAYMELGLPLPSAGRRTAESLIKFGWRMLDVIEGYGREEA
jgi:hypothetical protein